MDQALELASRAGVEVLPNPRVGALVVKDDQIVGKGWHRKLGGPHAEVYALKEAGSRARGATLYCSLEPCSHQGRQPPCTEAIIRSGLRRVVVAHRDPNPLVSGIERLRQAGLIVKTGILRRESKSLNPGFFSFFKTGLPYLWMKVATSLDGFMALENGCSQWLTGKESRRRSHALRARSAAVLTGIGTVLVDDPALNVRFAFKGRPARIVLDSHLRFPATARLLKTRGGKVHIFTTTDVSKRKINKLQKLGAKIHQVPADDRGHCNLKEVLLACAFEGWLEIHVEAGVSLSSALLREKFVSEIFWFQGPRILGQGQKLALFPEKDLKALPLLENPGHEILDSDVLWHGFLKN
jgi:diaminohydroxyphosphoribosylaminopyrimidine deaminase/5-amino-6-(5-phosphoribosylamino)uracil reductase